MYRIPFRSVLTTMSLIGRWTLTLRTLERFLTGNPWWRRKLRIATQRLEVALEIHDEASFETRRAFVQFRRADFAFRFGRPAHASVEVAVRKLSKNGLVPIRALWVLIINRDIQATPRGITVRRAWWAKPLKYAAQGIVLAGFVYLSLYTILIPGDFAMKLGILAVLSLIHGFGYLVWRIYAVLPVDITERYGDRIDGEFRRHVQTTQVIPIRPIR